MAVLDTAGKKPLGDVAVRASSPSAASTIPTGKRVVGGFYAYEHHTEFADLGEICSGRTDSRGTLVCDPRSMSPATSICWSRPRDAQGNLARAGTSYWVAGAGDTWFAAGNDDRIDVIPEKRSYAPGEKARFQVRMPFREATAPGFRGGRRHHRNRRPALSRYKPVYRAAGEGRVGPNVFVSVLAVRGRVQP